jgi:hypothetical protein
MKTLLIQAVFIILIFLTSCSFFKTGPVNIKEVTQKVQSKDFTVSVNIANPLRMRQFYLTSDYDLQLKNDSAFAFLPYFGVAYSAPYGGGEGGIKFAEPIMNYSVKSNRKSNGWDIYFKIKAKDCVYEFYMNIFNNGSSMFTVNSVNRDAITFNGEIKQTKN